MTLKYNINDLKAQVKRVLDHSNDMNAKVDKLLDKWKAMKQGFITEFGGELIIESPTITTMEKPDEDKIMSYRDFVSDIVFITHNKSLGQFLFEQGWTAFYENKVVNKFEKIPKGMKINRALKFFIEDQELLEKWQNKYSQLIQDVKISGRLCLSVHPLDYLSISETTHNWRSCHSLEGEYRAGNLSYMNDESTIVAYLKSEGEYKLPNFPEDVPWNSKKWRMLLYVNNPRELIFSSKPYPFDNKSLVDASFEMLQEQLGGTWSKEWIQSHPDDILDVMGDSLGSVQFNDCLCSSSYDPRYKTIEGKELLECTPISVGAPVNCLECEEDYIEFCSDYACCECGDYVTCEECGCNMYSDESYILDGRATCPGCYDESAVFCDTCGEVHHNESREIRYDETTSEWHCRSCFNNIVEARLNEILELDCD